MASKEELKYMIDMLINASYELGMHDSMDDGDDKQGHALLLNQVAWEVKLHEALGLE